MVNYTTTTLNKEGELVCGDVTYNVNVTVLNSVLIRLSCLISKKEEGKENVYVGNITLESGRHVIEIIQSENPITYITKFQEITDEILGKTPTT